MLDTLEERTNKEIHLRDYLNVILRRKWVLISFLVVVVVTIMIRTFSIRPTFRATCQVLIERAAPKIVKFEEVLALDARFGDEYYETQYEILKSNLIAQQVIKELNLTDHKEFNQDFQNNVFSPKRTLASLLSRIKALFLFSNVKAEYTSNNDTRLIHSYLRRLSIHPIEGSRLVNINFESYDPELAALVANLHAQKYIENTWERKFTTTQEAINWLKRQIKDVRKKLEGSEEQLQAYRKKNDLVSLDFGERHNIIIQKLSDLNNTLTRAKTTRIEKENIYKELKRISKDPAMIESIPAVLNNPLIQELKALGIKKEGEYSELSQKYGPEHPRMIQLRSQTEQIQDKIAREIKKIAQSIKTESRIALAKEKSLERALSEQKKEALDLNQKDIQYNLLRRDVDTNYSIYESLLNRLNETTLAEELEVTNINIVAQAIVPDSPVNPNKLRSFMLAMVLGLMGGMGLVFFFEYFDSSIKRSEDIEEKLGLLCLGHVEPLESDGSEKLITLHDQESIITEELHTIATNLLFATPHRPNQVFLITSALPQEGKTFLATNLSVILSRLGKKVLLIDTDMRNPTVHSLFKTEKAPGLSDYLVHGGMPLAHVRHTPISDITVMSAGTSVSNPSELLMSQRMISFITTMRENGVSVILDAPPVMMLSDALSLAPLVDGVVMVVKSGVTPYTTVQKTVQQLAKVNVRPIGVVLNKHDIAHESYYRDNYYRYYRKAENRERAVAV